MPSAAHYLSPEEKENLALLRQKRRERHHKKITAHDECTLAQHMADRVATIVGSWRFIIIQSVLLTFWIILNLVAWAQHWDPYPFILLNLVLSFQAAFTAPIIMMSQNRQAELDRHEAREDFEVNRKAELEIESLHEKMDFLREQEINKLIGVVEKLSADVVKLANKP